MGASPRGSMATSRTSARCRRSSCAASTTWRTSSRRRRARVAHALLIGEDAKKIGAALAAAAIPVAYCSSLQAAVEQARTLAVPGDVVLLSPACASFDMFDNFEHRGDVFKKLVERLDS